MKIIKTINNLTTLKCLVLHCGYMSSNSRWFLDTQHSSSFKAEHEEKFVIYTITINKCNTHIPPYCTCTAGWLTNTFQKLFYCVCE